MDNEVYSIKEAAKLLGVSSTYVYTLKDAGRIKAEKIGAQWIISREELERYKGSRVADSLQTALWRIKEATWQLLNEKGNHKALVKTVCQQVDSKMRELGYDPTVIVKHSTY